MNDQQRGGETRSSSVALCPSKMLSVMTCRQHSTVQLHNTLLSPLLQIVIPSRSSGANIHVKYQQKIKVEPKKALGGRAQSEVPALDTLG